MFKILTYFMTHPRETQHGLTVICYNTCLYDSRLRNFTFEKVELGGQSPFKGTCKKCTKDGSNKTATAVEVTATAVISMLVLHYIHKNDKAWRSTDRK